MKYGDRIALLREKVGLTQEELAVKIGITRAALSHYEKNRREADYETLVRIADFFGVKIDYLLGRTVEADQELSSDLERQFVDDIDNNLSDYEMINKYSGKIEAENLPIPDDDLIQIVHFLRVKRMTRTENG